MSANILPNINPIEGFFINEVRNRHQLGFLGVTYLTTVLTLLIWQQACITLLVTEIIVNYRTGLFDFRQDYYPPITSSLPEITPNGSRG